MDSVRFGLAIRALRRRQGWTQEELGRRAGVSKSAVSRVERAGMTTVSYGTLERLTGSLSARLAIRILWRGEELDRLLDSAHAALVDAVLRTLAGAGWEAWPEATFSIAGERGSIDVLAWHSVTKSLLVIEVKSVVPDLQAILASIDRKARLARAVARSRGWTPKTVSTVLVLPADRTSRRRVARFDATFARSLPARSVEVRRWIASPSGGLSGILFLADSTQAQPRQRVRRSAGPPERAAASATGHRTT